MTRRPTLIIVLVEVILLFAVRTVIADPADAVTAAPIYIWLEPEWFPGVKGDFNYWTGKAKPIGSWGIAGPGISAEFSQGGESEWQSMGVVAEETTAACERAIVVPRAGKYRIWVRYVDHRGRPSRSRFASSKAGSRRFKGSLGCSPSRRRTTSTCCTGTSPS